MGASREGGPSARALGSAAGAFTRNSVERRRARLVLPLPVLGLVPAHVFCGQARNEQCLRVRQGGRLGTRAGIGRLLARSVRDGGCGDRARKVFLREDRKDRAAKSGKTVLGQACSRVPDRSLAPLGMTVQGVDDSHHPVISSWPPSCHPEEPLLFPCHSEQRSDEESAQVLFGPKISIGAGSATRDLRFPSSEDESRSLAPLGMTSGK